MPSRRHAFWPVPEEPRQLRRPGVSRFPVRQRAAGQVLDSLLQRILTRSWPSAAIAASGSGSRGARGDIEQLARPWTCCRGSLPGAGQRRRSPPADPSATVPGATLISWPGPAAAGQRRRSLLVDPTTCGALTEIKRRTKHWSRCRRRSSLGTSRYLASNRQTPFVVILVAKRHLSYYCIKEQ